VAESRKVVTIVFSDVTGSTALGERVDPEAMRRVMERYFAEMRSALEKHGGTVEKFIGDAVMAVFGIPAAHEDDALRAVKAAAEISERLDELNRELEGELGVSLAIRTGINTGEVVVGDRASGEFYATGDAVNVAARLEQVADPGEILLGEETHRLVRDAVRIDAVGPLPLKGKAEPVSAYRLVEMIVGAPAVARRFDTPFVGREEELARLLSSFERSVAERAPILITVLGTAGIGKTRLAGEFADKVAGRAQVLQGRCLSYGEGITFWPLQEILRALPDRPPDVPEPERARSVEETFWAYRRLLEALAHRQPLVLLIEDIHWAESMLLDVLEHIVAWTHEAPITLLCLARPELLDERPGWPGERIELGPLTDEEARLLVDGLTAGTKPANQARVVEAAEGNPLFLEQMLALANDEPGAEIAMPKTIHALLDARLDQLNASERQLLQAAAVVGKEFWRSALLDLSPPETEVSALLQRLVRRRLIQPERSSLPGEDAFRFSHILIRDAAYDAIAKRRRAGLHERFADWLEELGSPDEEIVGYHLEQAYRYRSALGPVTEALRDLGDHASDLLGQAGIAAVGRRDPSAVGLLMRARELHSDPARRLGLSLRLAEALDAAGQPEGAWKMLTDVIEEARAGGEERTEWHAMLNQASLGTRLDPTGWDDRVQEIAERALRVFERLDDPHGLGRACALAGWNVWTRCRYDEAASWYERWLAQARRAGDPWEEFQALDSRLHAMFFGSTHAEAVLEEAEVLLARVEGSTRTPELLGMLAALCAMRGDATRSRTLYLRGKSLGEQLGIPTIVSSHAKYAEQVGLLLGDAEFAERELRAGYESLEAMGERGFRSTMSAQLADALYELGRYSEAEHFASLSFELTSTLDIASHAKAGAVNAKLLAVRGEYEAGERVAREAAELASTTDSLFMQAQVLMSLADVLRLASRDADAIPIIRRVVAISQQKGDLVTATKAKTRLAVLDSGSRV
jgi:class 3 adenylate cyclase/tetratricopeptide (TPR) repeat protein